MSLRRHHEHIAYERRRKRVAIVFSVFVVLSMVGAIFVAMLYNPTAQDKLEYGEHEIDVKELPGGGSVYTIDGNDIELQHLPPLVTYVEVDPGVTPVLGNAQQIALVADTNSTPEDLALVDYARLQLALGLRTPSFSAMTGENAYGLPVINCSAASPQMPVVLFTAVNDTPRIDLDGSCVIVRATGRGILAAKDRLLYERLGIIADGQVVEE